MPTAPQSAYPRIQRRRPRWVLPLAIGLTALVTAVGTWLFLLGPKRDDWHWPARSPARLAEEEARLVRMARDDVAKVHLLNPLVHDQDGHPVEGAQVFVRTCELVPELPMGRLVPRPDSKRAYSVFTGVQGRCLITLVGGENSIEIDAVRKPGYDWVTDLAWGGQPTSQNGDNRAYIFAGRFVKCPVYLSDNDRPPIFPLHKQGSTKPVASPSRGGSDLGCDGQVKINLPTVPQMPAVKIETLGTQETQHP